MPWNDNANPGPWGTPPKGEDDPPRRPEGRRGDGGGGRRPPPPGEPPNWFNDLNDRLGRLFGRGRGVQPGVYAVAASAVLLLWVMSGIYIVQASEVAVITQFGAYNRTEGPGFHVRWPSPIESNINVQVTSLRQMDIGAAGGDQAQEGLMITSDDSVVDLDFRVQWRVEDPVKFLFNLQDQEGAVQAVAESAMREVIGRIPVDQVISRGRGQVQTQTQEVMQRVLDSYDSGVRVVEVQINNSNPPAPVVPAFRSLQQANQEAASRVNQGNTYRNRVVNEAQGDAARITQAAEAYREQVRLIAEGQAARFNQLYDAYRGNPTVTRQRMYLETMERILSRVNKVVIDARGATAPIILPPDVFRPRAAPDAAAGTPAPAQQGTGGGGQ